MWQRERVNEMLYFVSSESFFEQLAYNYTKWLSDTCNIPLDISFEAILASERFLPNPYHGESPYSEIALTALIGEVLISLIGASWIRTNSGIWAIRRGPSEGDFDKLIRPQHVVAARLWEGISLPAQVHKIATGRCDKQACRSVSKIVDTGRYCSCCRRIAGDQTPWQ